MKIKNAETCIGYIVPISGYFRKLADVPVELVGFEIPNELNGQDLQDYIKEKKENANPTIIRALQTIKIRCVNSL